MGMNSTSRDEPLDDSFIIGKESPEIEILLHNGGISGSTSVFYTFPKTNSAIIVFANGVADGCAADPTGQLLIQAPFDLKPRVNILPFVESEAKKGNKDRYQKDLEEWHKHRDTSSKEASRTEYIGKYQARGLTLSVELERLNEGQHYLTVIFGGQESTKRKLEYFGKDTYSYFPQTQDEWFTEALTHWDWETGLLKFKRNSEGLVEGLIWKFSEKELPAEFKKMQ